MSEVRRPACLVLTLLLAGLRVGAAQVTARGDASRIDGLIAHGQLDQAEQLARAGGAPTEVSLGDVLVLRGRLAAADSVYREAVTRMAPGYRSAEAALAELAERRGDRATADRRAAALIAAYTQGRAWSPADVVAAGRAYVVLGAIDPQAFHSALSTFDAAAAADSNSIDAELRGADLLLSKYNAPDAEETYRTVLARVPGEPRALLGLARVQAFQGMPAAIDGARAALRVNPALVPALVFLADQELQREAYDSAADIARRALAVDSSAIGAWGIVGALAWIGGDSAGFQAARNTAERLAPRQADFMATVAEAAANVRRYSDAVALARQAVAIDSFSARALGALANNELRTGDMVAGRVDLERAFAIDPFNLWYKNTLDLLDAVRNFHTFRTDRFVFVAPPEDADYLALYLGPLLEKAYDVYAARYGYRPPVPIRIELYRRHADFSVRTLGLTGLDAVLGVSFGGVLAFDAPSARDPGDFNYGSVAWHELAHTFTLGASDHRVPRWVSEGLSVLEERRSGNGWGEDVSPDFLATFKGGRMPAATHLDDGLMRPDFPEEVVFSYYEASLVCEMIEAERGIAAIRAMLQAYAQGLDTPAVLQRVLGMTAPAFDQHFDAWLRARFATPLAALDPSDGKAPAAGPFVKAMEHGKALLDAGDTDSARAVFRRAAKLFPDYGGADGAAWQLAKLDQAAGDLPGAVSDLETVTHHVETAAEPNDLEATLRLQLHDSTGAFAALDRLQWITPYDPAVHVRLAELADAMGNVQRALLERRAILALGPADRLEARYQLARALMRAGDIPSAKREILGVLELAPTFEKAQDLLLKLQGSNH